MINCVITFTSRLASTKDRIPTQFQDVKLNVAYIVPVPLYNDQSAHRRVYSIVTCDMFGTNSIQIAI